MLSYYHYKYHILSFINVRYKSYLQTISINRKVKRFTMTHYLNITHHPPTRLSSLLLVIHTFLSIGIHVWLRHTFTCTHIYYSESIDSYMVYIYYIYNIYIY